MSTVAIAPAKKTVESQPATSAPTAIWVVAAVLGLAHLPLLIAHARTLWLSEHYQFFPLVLIGAVVLALPAIRAAVALKPSPAASRAGVRLLALNWVMLVSAVILESPWLGAAAFWELLAALAVAAGGWKGLRAALPALIYLLLIIPPPLGLDLKLINSLQRLTSKCSNRILDLFGVFHSLNGVVVESAGKSYEIEQACSGIHSLLSILACTVFYVFWAECFWLRGVLLVLAAVFWVIVNNVVRVVSIVYFDTRFGFDMANDWKVTLFGAERSTFFPHTLFGFLLFGLTLGLLFSTDRLLLFFGSAVKWWDTPNKIAAPAPAIRSSGYSGNRYVGAVADYVLPLVQMFGERIKRGLYPLILVAYLVPLLFQAGELALASRGRLGELPIVEQLNQWKLEDLPEKIDNWQRASTLESFKADSRDSEDHWNNLGAHSRVWRYKQGPLSVVLSFDYPFPSYHNLRECYISQGWTIDDKPSFNEPLPGDQGNLDCARFHLTRPFEQHAYNWFAEFNSNGVPVPAAEHPFEADRWAFRMASLKNRWLGLVNQNAARPLAFEVLQVQTLAESPNMGPLAEDVQKDIERFFVKGAEIIREKVAALAAPKS